LAALAQHSGSAVGLIGYDCIPAVSADLLPPEEPERFVHYLTLVKHAHRVSAISDCAAQEFAGFVAMLPAQGLTGPQVTACLLPGEPPPPTSGPDPAPELPTVVVVGSHEPRKNHLAVLHASEVLWREGHRFAVRFIGGASWASDAFDAQVRRLRSAGRPVEVDRSVDDDALWSAYRTATFTVFTSLHEGFGLPVVESLAAGTPVVTSDLGSLAEVAAPGGAVTIDPRDDDALVAAMRALLTDEALRTRLVAEALARPARGWADYAAETWAQLTARGPG
jgi:glycosyltransferase involved in cell wall biosynthesis